MDLFQFNADFIASVAGGHNDVDVTEIFAESVRAGADVLQERIMRTAGPEILHHARFANGAFEFPLDQDQYDVEFGSAGEPPQSNVRRAIIGATIKASREMSKAFDDR